MQRHVRNADEDLKLALDVVDSKDDEATADDRLVNFCLSSTCLFPIPCLLLSISIRTLYLPS